MKKKSFLFDPKRFYRKLEFLFNRYPINEEDPTSIIPPLEFLYKELNPAFRINNLLLYQKREKKYINMYKHLKEKDDVIDLSYRIEDIKRMEEAENFKAIMKNIKNSAINKDQYNLIFIVFGSNDQFMLLVKTEHDLEYFEQLYYLLSSFKYFMNQHLKLSSLNQNIYKASEIQNTIIPEKTPDFSDFSISATFIPAETVGGDVYDFIQLDDELLGITMADASGHGLPAALQARDVFVGLRMGIEKEHKIWAVINKLNKVIFETTISSRFVSLFYGEIEKDGLMTYVNAGHCNPIYIDENEVKELDVGGMVLGWTDQVSYRRGYQYLAPNSLLILYTDGITEARVSEDEEYGTERLINIAKKNFNQSSRKIMNEIIQDASKLSINSNWEDDVSLIVIKRK